MLCGGYAQKHLQHTANRKIGLDAYALPYLYTYHKFRRGVAGWKRVLMRVVAGASGDRRREKLSFRQLTAPLAFGFPALIF